MARLSGKDSGSVVALILDNGRMIMLRDADPCFETRQALTNDYLASLDLADFTTQFLIKAFYFGVQFGVQAINACV